MLGNSTHLFSPYTIVCAEEFCTRFQKIIINLSTDHHIIDEGSFGGRGGKCEDLTWGSDGHDGSR